MRETNELAKSTILKLIDFGPFNMTPEERIAFSTWAVMFSMTYEFADRGTLVTTQDDRTTLMAQRKPPKNWAVLTGLFLGGAWAEICNHRAMMLDFEEDRIPQAPNAQCNTFTIGKAATITLSGPAAAPRLLLPFAERHGLKIVWPDNINSVTNGRAILSDENMFNIARYF